MEEACERLSGGIPTALSEVALHDCSIAEKWWLNCVVLAYTFSRQREMPMRILIADDHPIVRHGLKQMLANDPSAMVVGEATNGDEALELARKVDWDMAIFDFSMPGRSGLDLLGDMKKEFPGRPVLILSMHSEDVHGSRVLRGGAAGYITKDSAPQELSTAVRKVANGGKYVSASLAEILASECSSDPQKALHEKLSDREYRVMWLLATGKQISEIAQGDGPLALHREHVSHAHPAQARPHEQRRAGALRRAPPARRVNSVADVRDQRDERREPVERCAARGRAGADLGSQDPARRRRAEEPVRAAGAALARSART